MVRPRHGSLHVCSNVDILSNLTLLFKIRIPNRRLASLSQVMFFLAPHSIEHSSTSKDVFPPLDGDIDREDEFKLVSVVLIDKDNLSSSFGSFIGVCDEFRSSEEGAWCYCDTGYICRILEYYLFVLTYVLRIIRVKKNGSSVL